MYSTYRNTKRALFELAWFWDVDPSDRFGFHLPPVLWVNVFSHCKPPGWFDGFHPINPCGFLALIVLGHSSHSYQSRRSGLHQQFLEFVDCSSVATLFGFEDAFLYAINMLF